MRTIKSALIVVSGILIIPVLSWAQWNPPNPVSGFEKDRDGLLLHLQTGQMRLTVCTESLIHVEYTPGDSFPNRKDYVVTKTAWPAATWNSSADSGEITLTTAKIKVEITRKDGVLTYRDSSGKKLVAEGPKTMTAETVDGEQTYRAEDFFNMYGSHEAIYGLGQHQAGVWNYRGESVDLSQENTNIAIPLWMSSNGYGVFWNNTSRSRVNNRFIHYMYVSSEVADSIDYYFIYGPDFDSIVAAYRELTGKAPLLGRWAYGFWQSKNRYSSQSELLGVARKYRELHIPVDNIVQDWFWWTRTGEMKFNGNYPDPQQMINELHSDHFHLMLSIWPFFYPGTSTYEDMKRRGFFFDYTKVAGFHPQGMAVYDATNPEARKYYWNLVKPLFEMGVDAWWMDTTEPETEGREENVMLDRKLAIGSGTRYANIFPLLDTSAIYDGQRSETDKKRVFILSRSAFAGSQRYGVTAWSGDVLSDFETYKRQIPAGLNFALSGMPYWTTDIGGFIMGDPASPAYRELFVRWFQYGAFCPIFRTHGTRTTKQNELWSYGAGAQQILTKFDMLRYRLLPYIYSLAWKVTDNSYTIMRPLVMDFRDDPRVFDIGDQFMFGPSILVNPVTEENATNRHLYLPETKWYDFWTGAVMDGGKAIDAPAPLDRIPLFVRAGSIVPLGPEEEWAAEKPDAPFEIRVFRGADADFTLYEDEGDSYNYEKGMYATIPFHWDDGRQVLTIADRKGQFPGMPDKKTFQIVFVAQGHGADVSPTASPDKIVEYSGKQVLVQQ
ncbi:MAG: glycoside hydrolase family 31 protein [Bryobacteraceae bacterium]